MPAIQYKDLLIDFTTEFVPLWNDKGTQADDSVTFWRPSTASNALANFTPLGDVAINGYHNINQQKIVAVVSDVDPKNGTALRAPIDFQLIWKHSGPRARTAFSLWRAVAPDGYVAMGSVCGVGNDKPPLNTVRCVRADLVHTSYVSHRIWHDKGSGAEGDFSAWGVALCETLPGETCFAPGTFVGVSSHIKPSMRDAAYVLRADFAPVRLPLPPLPTQMPAQQAHAAQVQQCTYTCELPWFVVRDENLGPVEQLRTSPRYRLERRDHYQMVGIGRNEADTGRTFKWTTAKGENGSASANLAAATGIELIHEWSQPENTSPLGYSARLDKAFTQTTFSSEGWERPAALEVAAFVPANRAIAAFLQHSEYTLVRTDGSQLELPVHYTDGEQVHFTELLPEEPESTGNTDENDIVIQPALEALEVTAHDVTDNALLP